MEQEKQLEPKRVNLAKLNLLTNEQLLERIKEIPIKIKSKQDYYAKLNQTNQERLKVYISHKREDEATCKKILSERQKPAASEKKPN